MKKLFLLCMCLVLLGFSCVASAGQKLTLEEQIRKAGITKIKYADDANQGSITDCTNGVCLPVGPGPAMRKANVAVFYTNDANTKYDKRINVNLFKYLNTAMPETSYNLVASAPYRRAMENQGIYDFIYAEKEDFINLFQRSGTDYLILLQVDPTNVRDKATMFSSGKIVTMSITCRILDLHSGKFIYSRSFNEKDRSSSFFGRVGSKGITMDIVRNVGNEIAIAIQQRMHSKFLYDENTLPGRKENAQINAANKNEASPKTQTKKFARLIPYANADVNAQ